MRRWTVRVDDDIAKQFADFCAIHGISIQAALEAMVRNLTEQHVRENGKDVNQYGHASDEVRDRFILMVSRARAIDHEHRHR